MRRLSAVLLATALTLTAACSGGDKDSGGSDGPARKLFQPAGVVGPDSFAPTFAVASYDVDPATLTSGDVSGGAPGLYAGRTYGGSGANICDVEAMIRFLTYYEDRGRAWAAIQGIAFEELESYLRSLTPVFALQNLNVQMFGFKNGQSYGYDAVIAAGTAILVDDEGMPRARCACGNPLLGPSEDAPEGTDIPPTTDEGNPETQDSVPEDSVPGDSVPGDTPPGDNPPEQIPPGTEPGDDPECPEEFQGARYTDANGVEWIWTGDAPEELGTAMWIDQSTGEMKSTAELDPAFEDCPPPDIPQQGDPECPEEFQGARYTDANGVEWIWTGDAPEELGTAMWIDQSTGEMKATTDLDPAFADCDGPDQPRTQEEPECPDWNSDPIRYTDPSGMVWEYDRVNGTWFSTTDADLFKVATEDLPGYLELCDEPGERQPGGDCPEQLRGGWTLYYASNGDVWTWEFTSPETGYWVNQNGEIANFLIDIPGYLEDCGEPSETFTPECPEPFTGTVAVDWTPYLASNGDLWIYDWKLDQWENQNTGQIVAGYDPSAIPGYLEDCGEPPTEDDPCPPTYPSVGDSWTDPETGDMWIYVIVRDGREPTRVTWRNKTTGDERSAEELFKDECGEPDTSLKPVCPPVEPSIGTVWYDTTGEQWYFAAGTGGAAGWDRASTLEIENLTYDELPNKPSGCPEPRRPFDCPPIVDVPQGYVWFGHDGNIYRYSSADGGWVNESDPSGQVVAYTVLLPGYRKYCLPPCPPLNVLDTKTHAVWVDPSNGDRWVKTVDSSVWVNQNTGETLARTEDLPFYTEDCLPPCDPEAEGGKTYVINDEGLPETNEAFEDEYGDTADKAVTVVADAAGVNPQQIIEQLIDAVTAIGDDCNPNGCVEPDTEPELGHSFRDSRGVLWRYVGDGNWQAENGDFVTYILDIPGYVDACLPPDVPVDRECPPEFKGSEYTDGNGIVWTWVGSHSTPAESDHGQYWYYRYEDGSEEYRYTFQLESFFDDCPRPDDVQVQESGIYVTMRVPKSVCVGDVVPVAMTVIIPPDTEITEAKIYTDGNDLETIEAGAGLYIAQFTADEVGTVDVKGVAKNADGVEGSSSVAVEITECGDDAGQGGVVSPDSSTPDDSTPGDSTPATPPADSTPATPSNTPPVVTVTATPECIEITSGTTKTYSVTVTASDADGDDMTVLLNNGILGRWTIAGSGTQSKVFTANDQNRGTTLSFTATADDGQAVTTSNTATVRVQYSGGCNPTPSTTANTAPAVSLATKPAQTVTVCKTGTNSSVPVTVSINVNDPQGDTTRVTLSSYNRTTSLGTVAREVGTVVGSGIVTATETVTSAQIGHTIEYIGRADDGTFTGIGRTTITVVERTTGCTTTSSSTSTTVASQSGSTTTNKAPTVVLTNKTWPGCINQKDGSPVSFTIGDTSGSTLTVSILVNKEVVQSGKKDISLTGTATFSYTFTSQMAGKSVVVEVTDEKGLKGQSLSTTLTQQLCP